jgi:hypothetical protein
MEEVERPALQRRHGERGGGRLADPARCPQASSVSCRRARGAEIIADAQAPPADMAPTIRNGRLPLNAMADRS